MGPRNHDGRQQYPGRPGGERLSSGQARLRRGRILQYRWANYSGPWSGFPYLQKPNHRGDGNHGGNDIRGIGSPEIRAYEFLGPNAADIIRHGFPTASVIWLLQVWKPAPRPAVVSPAILEDPPTPEASLTAGQSLAAWAPWILLAAVMVAWSHFHLFSVGQRSIPIPHLHNAVFITLYHKPYAAFFPFQPLAAGTAAFTAMLLTALLFRTPPRTVVQSGMKTLRQLRMPALTVGLIVGLAYLYNYSGMAYTLGASLAGLGKLFPLVSGFLGWIACFLSGSDTSSNLLFGNLQVAAAHQIGVSPILLAATNSSGAVMGKMISPQNIAVGVTTVGLVGHEGDVLRSTIGHSLLLALLLSLIAMAQAYWLPGMIP